MQLNLKIVLVGSLFALVQLSCTAPKCTDYDLLVLDSAATGNFGEIRQYLEAGGDPNLCCYHTPIGSGRGLPLPVTSCLPEEMANGMTVEFAEYYFEFDIEDKFLNDMLYGYIRDFVNSQDTAQSGYFDWPDNTLYSDTRSDTLADMLLEKGAHYDPMSLGAFESDSLELQFLASRNYDFNWQDPEYGSTVLMDVAWCYCQVTEYDTQADIDAEVARRISLLNFLVEHGARTNLKNKEGKTALDQATHPEIKKHLMSLEKQEG